VRKSLLSSVAIASFKNDLWDELPTHFESRRNWDCQPGTARNDAVMMIAVSKAGILPESRSMMGGDRSKINSRNPTYEPELGSL
jgi:hypothetical protein